MFLIVARNMDDHEESYRLLGSESLHTSPGAAELVVNRWGAGEYLIVDTNHPERTYKITASLDMQGAKSTPQERGR